jgi:hypothetical protein
MLITVVGLEKRTNGRNCDHHDVCGSVLTVGSIVRFQKTRVTIRRRTEDALAVILVNDGIESCRIGFLQRAEASHFDNLDQRSGVIKSILSDSEDKEVRTLSYSLGGAAECELIENMF